MVLYLAGLKSVDPTLREAAAIDGANERQTFFRVVFPVMRPINVVILVITVIESLRAFDIVYIINKGKNGLELLSVLITNNIIGEASLVGFGSAIAVVLLVISLVPDHRLPDPHDARRTGMTAGRTRSSRSRSEPSRHRSADPLAARRPPRRSSSAWRCVWLFPLAVDRLHVAPAVRRHRRATATSRSPTSLTLDNFSRLEPGRACPQYFLNTLIIVVPAVILDPAARVDARRSSFSRFSFRLNLLLLMHVHGRQPAARRRSSSRRSTGCTWPSRCPRR